MWIYVNLFVVDNGNTHNNTDNSVNDTNVNNTVKILFFQEKKCNPEHALRRMQTFDTIVPIATEHYWYYYDREILAKRNASITMTLASFAMFFTHMENRWVELMRVAIDDAGGGEDLVDGFHRFCDEFEVRYSHALARYTDLVDHEHNYAWLCLLYANTLRQGAFLTNITKNLL